MAQAGVDNVHGSQPPPSIDIIDVSRTVQSTDLFTPYRKPRVTLPTIGEFQQSALPFGGKYWGGPLTEYGGIGDLSFRGRQRVRDLEVTRSHRHYRSGFSKYLTDIQPYRLTELHLSECRLNDQILPAPLQADISRLNWQRELPWPDSRAYGTHHSIFEVFPSVKPELPPTEKEPHHNYRSRNAQKPLVKSTQKALLELSRKLYQSTLYQDSFLDYCKPRQNYSATTSLLPRQPRHPQPHPPPNDDISDTIMSSIPLAKSDFSNKDREKEENEEQTGDVEECLSGDEEENEEDGNGEEDVTNDVTTNDAPTDDAPHTTETTIPRFEIKPNQHMTGIGPCWPYGSSYVFENINRAQMLERMDITCHSNATPMKEKKQQRLLSARRRLPNRYEGMVACNNNTGSSSSLVATLMSKDAFLKHKMQQLPVHNTPNQSQEPTLQTNYITAPLPVADHDVTLGTALRLPAVHSSQKLGPYPPFLIQTNYHDRLRKLSSLPWSPYCGKDVQTTEPSVDKSLGAPGVTWKGKAPLVLPPAPLADCLSSAGTRTPHKLGLRYKSEAHKRYHLMHPDIIPDLRTNLEEGKKYFFCGFHSSVFRG